MSSRSSAANHTAPATAPTSIVNNELRFFTAGSLLANKSCATLGSAARQRPAGAPPATVLPSAYEAFVWFCAVCVSRPEVRVQKHRMLRRRPAEGRESPTSRAWVPSVATAPKQVRAKGDGTARRGAPQGARRPAATPVPGAHVAPRLAAPRRSFFWPDGKPWPRATRAALPAHERQVTDDEGRHCFARASRVLLGGLAKIDSSQRKAQAWREEA